ncbi:Glycosyltransferase, GT2 family [Aequorivita viscosa]|uniref:Glycosyltransferase, GT2 family n=2 Tax=Aequorivita viscosa TaxID=797419 RepID=A0A1M6GI03_9FLAO|nr:Glycosyltransferase, GT2 family [Aequorivita viscosa]SHJ09556.1 Glycosyltransferase, GT2 family [Aequorivita viscosa]
MFKFFKYIHPTWYYNLKPKLDYAYFPTVEILVKQGYDIEKDIEYNSIDAQNRDLAWRAFQQGFIINTAEQGLDVWQEIKLPIEDEYRFFRKNFHKLWAVYVLFFRLITLHNPFKELSAFWKTRNVQRQSHVLNHFEYPGYNNFKSKLIEKQPLISVVIPTLNRYDYLKDVFKDLEQQTYKNFEVIVVDQTDDFQEDFYKGWNLDLKFWFQEEKALWKARNEAIKSAKGEFILMSEDDIRIPETLIENHIKTIDFFNADVSCGVFFPQGSTIPKERNYFKYAEQFATGNAMLRRDIFKKVGLYDRQFEKQRGGDGEFGLRLYQNGYKLVSNPIAYCIDVKAPEGGLRVAGGSWDAWRPKKWNAPRPVPSVLYLARKYFGNKKAVLMVIPSVAPSLIPYQFKRNKILKLMSLLLLPLLLPLLIFQVTKSWRLASEKLKQGAMIAYLN